MFTSPLIGGVTAGGRGKSISIAISEGDAVPEKDTAELNPLIDLIFIVTLARPPFGMDKEFGIADNPLLSFSA